MKLDLIQLKTYPLGNTGQDVHTVIYRAMHSLSEICLLYCPYRQLQMNKRCPHKNQIGCMDALLKHYLRLFKKTYA